MQLFVFSIFTQLVIHTFFMIHQFNQSLLSEEHVRWEVFIEDFRGYLQEVEEISVEKQAITLRHVDSNEKLKISKYNDLIRLQVDGKGHVPLLIGVRTVEFAQENQFITIQVTFPNGIRKERTLFVQTS